MYLDHAKTLVEQLCIAKPDEVHPCTADEVAQLERRIGRSLPAAYREFLLWMGRGAARLLVGTDFFYDDIKKIEHYRESAQELLDENGIRTPIPEDAFIFYMHQGYQFMYFRLTEGDNPPIYYYGEGEGYSNFRTLNPSFSDFLETEIKGHARLMHEITDQARKAAETRAEWERRNREGS